MNGAGFRSRWTYAFVAAAAVLVLLSACVLPGAGTETGSTALDAPPNAPPPRTFHRPEDHFFDVLTFNTALLPEYASYTQPAARVPWLAQHLAGYDALVLQEAFVDAWRERILDELADAYPYRGELVGHDGARGLPLRQDGGIVILSRWPIVRQATMLFGATCSGLDCLSDKGVAYVAVQKGERTYHLFGTHAQSTYGWRAPAVRAAQFELFSAFVAEQEIPEDEVVLLAGDFNVDAYTPELESMLVALGANWPPVIGSVTATWDPDGNVWADGGRVWLDYVLVANGYGTPVAAWNRALPLRADGLALSDHYAVWGRVAMAPFTSISSTRCIPAR